MCVQGHREDLFLPGGCVNLAANKIASLEDTCCLPRVAVTGNARAINEALWPGLFEWENDGGCYEEK